MTQQPVQLSRQRVQSALRRGGHHSAARSSSGYQVSEEGGHVTFHFCRDVFQIWRAVFHFYRDEVLRVTDIL